MPAKVLLVGGSGYIGRHLKQCLGNDYHVFVSGTSDRLEDDYFRIDFSDPETFESIRAIRFDIVILLAASIRGIGDAKLTNPDMEVNTIRTGHFLQFIADHRITGRIVHISSMTVYAVPEWLPVSETAKRSPLSVYGLSKKIMEDVLAFFSVQNSIPVLVLRIPGMFGGDRKSGHIYHTVVKALENSDIVLNTEKLGYWECMDVEELGNTIAGLLSVYRLERSYEVFNIGYGQKIDFVNVAQDIARLVKSRSAVSVQGKIGYVDFFLDNAKLKNYIPFHYTFDNALRQYVYKLEHELRNR